MGSKFADILTAIVFVALATTLVAHKGTSSDISAAGNAFSGSIKAATGNVGG
jgi:hypothetical protein